MLLLSRTCHLDTDFLKSVLEIVVRNFFVKSDQIISKFKNELLYTPEKTASKVNKDAVFITIKLHFIIYLLIASALLPTSISCIFWLKMSN